MIVDNILGFLKKNFKKQDFVMFVAIVGLFILTRIVNIEKFPIFNDEGIYIQWAKTAWHDASWRFISLTDGKQPLQTWGTIPLLKLFPDNALFAGRMFTVLTGFIALVGLFSLLFYLFDKKTAYIGSLLYIFCPYFLFYDRLALVDSGVNAGFIWVLLFSILLARTIRLDISLIFGIIGGLALLTKSSAQVFIGLAVFGPIFFFSKKFEIKKFINRSINFFFLLTVTILIASAIYNIQRLSPFLHFVSEKNKVFLLSFSDFIKSPFLVFYHNLVTLPLYVFWEMGFILGITGIIGWLFIYKQNKNLFIYLTAWFISLFLGVCFFTRVLYPRYLIFFASLFLITAAYWLGHIKNQLLKVAVITALFISFIIFDYPIIFNIKNIPFPPVDRGQYLEGWTAGWGIREIVQFAKDKSYKKPVIILAEGNFGMTGDVLNVFINSKDRIFVKGYWPLTKENLLENQKELKTNLVYIVISHEKPPTGWPMKFINKFEKPNDQSAIYLFELAL